MRISLFPALALSLLVLSACETTDPDLGYSVNRAVASQAVDMNPSYAGLPIEGSNGVRAFDAQRRYLKGTPRPLARIDGRVDQTGASGAAQAGGREAPPAANAGNSN